MEYGRVNEDLIREFPELSPAYQLLLQECKGEQPGQYIHFEDVFARYIECLLAAPSGGIRDGKLRSVFAFIERMFLAGGEVRNLAFVGMLEGRSSSWLRASKPYLGPKAEAALDEYDSNWRVRSSKSFNSFSVESRDRYGIEETLRKVLAGAA